MIASLLIATSLGSLGATELVLKGLDPVELVQGREVPGKPDISAVYLRHEYRFANKSNLARFRRGTHMYAVHAGGACGKMGELTGRGSPDRFAVAKGRIFLFASDSCRETFLANVDSYFAVRGVRPDSSNEDKLAARHLLERTVAAHGGSLLRKVISVVWTYETPYSEGGERKVWKTRWAFLGSNRIAQWEEWHRGRVFFVLDGRKSFEGKPGEHFAIHPEEKRELVAQMMRHPIGIVLGAGAEPIKLLNTGDGFVMCKDDVVFTVRLHPETHLITNVEFRDVFSGPIRDVVIEYSSYKLVDGLQFPMSSRIKVDGGNWSAPKAVASVEVNGPKPIVFADVGL